MKRFYIPSLDGLRFVAFLLVFIHHANLWPGSLLQYVKSIGWVGVDIFFCLSAYLLTTLLMREIDETNHIHVLDFYRRRILRVWPLYFSYVIPVVVLHAVRVGVDFPWLRLFGLITFTDNAFAGFDGFNPISFTGHLWTISFEEQFYIVLPLFLPWLIGTSFQKRLIFFSLTAILAFGIRMLAPSSHDPNIFAWVMPLTHGESLILGVVCALYVSQLKEIKWRYSMSLMSVCLICLFWVGNEHMLAPSFAAVLSFLMIMCTLNTAGGPFNQVLSWAPLRFLGRISYGMYVFHIVIMRGMDWLLGVHQPVLNLALSFAAITLVSALSFYLLENPFLRRKEKYTYVPSNVK